MNTNRLYRVQIYVSTNITFKNLDGVVILEPHDIYEKYVRGVFVKNTIVYHTRNDHFIDLESKEKYRLGISKVVNTGDMYISLESGFKPVNINFKKNNMSRKRILMSLSNNKLLNKKEDDK